VAMASAMNRLATDRTLVETMGARARTFAASFTWDRCARETEAHLQQVIASNR